MKIFYDDDGNIVGTITGLIPGSEDNFHQEGANELIVSEELALQFNDPQEPADPHNFKVLSGQLVPKPADKGRSKVVRGQEIDPSPKKKPPTA